MKTDALMVFLVITGVLGFVLLIAAIILTFRYYNEKNRESIVISKKNTKVRWMHASYAFFSEFFLTKSYVRRIRRRYEIIEPSELSKIEEDTMMTVYIIWGVSGIAFLVCIFISFSLYMAFVGCYMVHIISNEVVKRMVSKKEDELMQQLEVFLNDVRHNYYANGGAVGDAIEECLADAPTPISIHMQLIHDILNASDMDEEVAKYNESVPNRFLKGFLANCVNTVRFDDKKIGETPLFIQNLNSIKEEMDIENRKKELIRHKLEGNTPVIVLPMCFLTIISNWAEGNMPELSAYYDGAYGIICTVVIIFATIATNFYAEHMKELGIKRAQEHPILSQLMEIPFVRRMLKAKAEENYGQTLRINEQLRQMGETLSVEQFYLKKYAYAVGGLVFSFCIVLSVLAVHRDTILTDTKIFDKMEMVIYDMEIKDELQTEVLTISERMKNAGNIDTTGIREYIKSQNILADDYYVEAVEQLVRERVREYQLVYMKWWHIIICFTCMIAGYRIPDFTLKLQKKQVEMEMENEMIQFQSIILMLMHIERISSRDILEQMEQFASVFKGSISTAIDNFNDGEQEALEQLKKDESTYAPFVRLVDNLIISDANGVENSFEEVAADRKTFQEKRKQDNTLYIDRQHSFMSLVAFIPFALTVGLYLIAPMVMECMNRFSGLSSEFNNIL